VNVQVPIYYSLTGDERFLLDSFQDDIVSENRYVELNTDIIPRGHLTLNNFNIKSDEFRNPNVWLRAVVEDDIEVKRLLKQVRAIPITVNYDLAIYLKNEIDVFKCAQEIMNTLWLYRFIYFEHNYMNIDAVVTVPDSDNIEIQREKNLKSDNTIKLTLTLEVQTYYPAFTSSRDCKCQTTAAIVSGSNIIKVGPVFNKACFGFNSKSSSISEIKAGQKISAVAGYIPNGIFVESVDPVNFELTLSKPLSVDVENLEITILQEPDGSVIQPYRTRWFNNLQPLNSSSSRITTTSTISGDPSSPFR
jgi:hypothetical protein